MKTTLHFKPDCFLPITENWIYEQMAYMDNYRHIVYTETGQNLEIFAKPTIRIIRNANNPKNIPDLMEKGINLLVGYRPSILLSLIKDKPDIVHAHFGPNGYFFLPYKKLTKKPLLTSFYGYDIDLLIKEKPVWKKRYQRLFQKGDGFLVEGSQMKKKLEKIGCPGHKIMINHLGVNPDIIHYQKRDIDINNTINIMLAGRFTEKKGIPFAIEAIGSFLKKYPDRKIQINIIGDCGNDNESKREKEKIMEKINDCKLSAVTRFFGFLSHREFIKQLYKNHLFICPSITAASGDSEGGSPVTATAASASGMTVISTDHCDIPEVIRHGYNGLNVPEKNSPALCAALDQAIHDPKKMEYWGKNGRSHIVNNYNAFKQSIFLSEIYDKFTGSISAK